MSIPLDRLYNFLHDVCNQDILIYRFFPHGSKKPEDLLALHNFSNYRHVPILICHDQEPLLYTSTGRGCNLREALFHSQKLRHILLLHSEKNSPELDNFVNDRMFPVYYWSHALISLDWFRYANIDPVFQLEKTVNKTFLIYQRAWDGSREYRLKFTELLLNNNLTDNCAIKFNPVENGQHYKNHTFKNYALKINRYDFEDVLPLNDHESHASADYNNRDYLSTEIEIVLETLFDDTRWHLTEKALRPIACGQPFMFAATQGSLKYLRSYGFKTFSPYINEEYDDESDSLARLEKIIAEMKRISNLAPDEKATLLTSINEIAKYNKDHFFSQEFYNSVVNEYKGNLEAALDLIQPFFQRKTTPPLWTIPL